MRASCEDEDVCRLVIWTTETGCSPASILAESHAFGWASIEWHILFSAELTHFQADALPRVVLSCALLRLSSAYDERGGSGDGGGKAGDGEGRGGCGGGNGGSGKGGGGDGLGGERFGGQRGGGGEGDGGGGGGGIPRRSSCASDDVPVAPGHWSGVKVAPSLERTRSDAVAGAASKAIGGLAMAGCSVWEPAQAAGPLIVVFSWRRDAEATGGESRTSPPTDSTTPHR